MENSAFGSYMAARALEISNLSEESIKFISLSVDEQEKAFLQHDVDRWPLLIQYSVNY